MSQEIRLPPLLSEPQLRALVREAIELRRHALVFQAAEIWEELLRGVQVVEERVNQPQWRPIASLSQLRGLVGVRFQKLREQWVAAGFPLREHRGDRPIRPEIDEPAWQEFVAWLQGEGFLVRRATPESEAFFEISKQESIGNGR